MKKLALAVVLIVATVGFSAWALPGYPYPTVWGTAVNVVDGNRIVVEIVGATDPGWIVGSQETVRYLGCYADPADATLCGAIAAQVNYQMVFGRLVYLEFDQMLRDADGTLTAYVYLDGGGYSMVNAMLVVMGLSKATAEPSNERYASVFLDLEATALRLGLGCLAPR